MVFSITEKYKNLVSQLYPDDVVSYYNPFHGVALVCGECVIGLYVTCDIGYNDATESHADNWAFVMEFSRSDIEYAFDMVRTIEKHRCPHYYSISKGEHPSNAAEIFELDAWDGQPLPF